LALFAEHRWIGTDRGHYGLGVSSDGDVVVVSNVNTHTVSVHSYAVRSELKIGSYLTPGSLSGQLDQPAQLCITPWNTIIVAELRNQRLQEFTMMGQHVRFIGPSTLPAPVSGVAANSIIIVATLFRERGLVTVFDADSGAVLRSFGDAGVEVGSLSRPFAVCITPDNDHVLVSEAYNARVSMFTLFGQIVKCFGGPSILNLPQGLCFLSKDTFAVTCKGSYSVVVLSLGDGSVVHKFGRLGHHDPGCFAHPIAVSVSRGRLFVLDSATNRVQVFE
jgi:DNA-binding beta-propeller fold protein YncE